MRQSEGGIKREKERETERERERVLLTMTVSSYVTNSFRPNVPNDT